MVHGVELLRTLHGHLGVLAVAGLVHPATFLRPGRRLSRGQRASVWASSLLFVLVYGSGLALYPGYREQERGALLRHDFALAMWFERKEHLAFVAVVLVVTALGLVVGDREGGQHQRARWMYAVAAVLGTVAAGVGTVVGAWRP